MRCKYLFCCEKRACWFIRLCKSDNKSLPVCGEHVLHYQEDPKRRGKERIGRRVIWGKNRYDISRI